MSVDELFPAGTTAHLLPDILGYHWAAAVTSRLSGSSSPGLTEAQLAQRQAILKIAAKILVKERDKLLDQFSTSWLRYRDLPIPTQEVPAEQATEKG